MSLNVHRYADFIENLKQNEARDESVEGIPGAFEYDLLVEPYHMKYIRALIRSSAAPFLSEMWKNNDGKYIVVIIKDDDEQPPLETTATFGEVYPTAVKPLGEFALDLVTPMTYLDTFLDEHASDIIGTYRYVG